MKLRLLAGATAASMLCASNALADPAPSGWYGAIDVGAQWAGDVNASSFFLSTKVKSDVGYAVFGRVGYKVSPFFRIELEGGANPSGVRSITGNGVNNFLALCALGSAPGTCPSPRGGLQSWPIMVNGIWDFLGDHSRWDPFIGGGLGAAFVRLDSSGTVLRSCVGCQPVLATIEGDQTQFAWQLIGGVGYRVNDQLTVDVAYHYLDTQTVSFRTAVVPAGFPSFGTISGHYYDQRVTLGLRYLFATVPPPPPPPAKETKEFIVYFAFDQYVLTPDAQSVVQEAATYATSPADQVSNHISVVGHTDTSGSFAYNMRLSERRAKATADQLVADGVNQSILDVSWKGFTQPAVDTGPGVKEPLNRRAVIDVQF